MIYRAKQYIEDVMFSIIGNNLTDLFESSDFVIRKAVGNYKDEDILCSVIGVGMRWNGQLEIALDRKFICHSKACYSLLAKICDAFHLAEHNVLVHARSKSSIHYKYIQSGSAVGHRSLVANSSYGTLGGFLIPQSGDGGIKIFSNNHVLANSNNALIGDSIYKYDTHSELIGRLENFVPIDRNGKNYLDLAVASLNQDVALPAVNHLKRRLPQLEEIVIKVGAATGETFGFVSSIDYTDKVSYGKFDALFTEQIQIRSFNDVPFSSPGDSGSIIYSSTDNAFIGLLFGGSGVMTLANPEKYVYSQLNQWRYIR